MHTRHGLFLIPCLAALAACPADPSLETLGNAETADSESPGSESSDPGSTDPGPTDPGPTTTSTSDTSTTAGSSTTTTVDTSDSGDTDTTGTPACAPIWDVPDVDADALAAHDLAWVGCGYTACDPDEPGIVCDDLGIADAPLTYLGHMHPNESGAFTTDDVISPDNIAWLDGPRHIYRYGDAVYILTEADEPADQLDVFYTARALEILRTAYPSAYQQLLVDQTGYPGGAPLEGFTWKNRVRSFVFSFDSSPFYTSAGLTVLDAAPLANMRTGLDEYSNVAAISIDREAILGSDDMVGSRPIYNAASDDENFLRFMRDGLAETLVHELVHLRVDRLNSTDADMRELYNHRTLQNACAQFELEEALVAATSLLYFRVAGGLSDAYLDYNDALLETNLAVVAGCADYATWSQQFSLPSGVDERYDLRLFDLQ